MREAGRRARCGNYACVSLHLPCPCTSPPTGYASTSLSPMQPKLPRSKPDGQPMPEGLPLCRAAPAVPLNIAPAVLPHPCPLCRPSCQGPSPMVNRCLRGCLSVVLHLPCTCLYIAPDWLCSQHPCSPCRPSCPGPSPTANRCLRGCCGCCSLAG